MQYVPYSVSLYSLVLFSVVQSEKIVVVATQHVIAQTDYMSRIYCTPFHAQHTIAIVGIQALAFSLKRPLGRLICVWVCLGHAAPKEARSTRSNKMSN